MRQKTLNDAGEEVSKEADRDYVNSFARGLEVIRAFTRTRRAMTLSEVAERTGMNRAATRRFLLTLVREGYAGTDGKRFQLLPKILDLGFSALASLGLTDVAQPILDDLAEAVQESCFTVILDGHSVVYVAKAHFRRIMVASVDIGSRAPAYTMSSGRVLLSGPLRGRARELSPRREARGADAAHRHLEDQAQGPHRRGEAARLLHRRPGVRGRPAFHLRARPRALGQIIAALNVACPSPRFTLDEMRMRVLPKLLDSANAITRFLS